MVDQTHKTPISMGVGALSALIFLLVFSGNIFLTFLGHLALTPLFVLGLVYGPQAVLIGCVVGALCTFLFGAGEGLINYSLNAVGPAVLMSVLAFRYRLAPTQTIKKPVKKWYPEGYLILALCGYYIGLMIIGFVLLQDDINHITQTLTKGGAFKGVQGLEPFSSQDLGWMIYVMGGPSLMIMTVVNGCFAGRLIKGLNVQTMRPSPRLNMIRLPWSLWVLFAGMGLLALVIPHPYNKIALSGVLIAGVGLSLEGFALIHRLAGGHEKGPLFLWVFYGCMILFVWPFLIVVMLGIFDPWIDLEARLKKREES